MSEMKSRGELRETARKKEWRTADSDWNGSREKLEYQVTPTYRIRLPGGKVGTYVPDAPGFPIYVDD